jgi:hypothetical protein
MDYTYKWASHYGERIPSKQLIGGPKPLSSSNYIFIQFLEFLLFFPKHSLANLRIKSSETLERNILNTVATS